MQFMGFTAGHPVLILVDSGSSHSFISSAIAASLPGVRLLPVPMTVRVADGGVLSCQSELPDMELEVQDHSFHSTLRVLSLGSYDIILGMDWLSAFSPMKVNWQDKWMSIPYGPSAVVLQALQSSESGCNVIQLFNITSDATVEQQPLILPQVQEVLDEFSDIFAEPSSLPSRQNCDHTIPLIPGAQPVSIQQYRYSPNSRQKLNIKCLCCLKMV